MTSVLKTLMVFVSFPAGFGNCFATLTSHFRTRHVIDSPKLLGASESAEGEGGGGPGLYIFL